MLRIGTETQIEYMAFELARAARKLVEEIALVQPGENVVITADTASDWRLVQATAGAAYAARAVPVVIWYETRHAFTDEPPTPVTMALTSADVWIEYAVGTIFRSQAYQRALERGCRYLCFTGMDVDMIIRTVGEVDYPGLLELGSTLQGLVAEADQVVITSPGGTEFEMRNGGCVVLHSGKLADTPGEPVMLGGQIGWLPLEDSIEGKIVCDGAIWPPEDLGLLRAPVELTVREGVVRSIEGGEDAHMFRQWMSSFDDSNMYRLAHVSLGFNPGVTRPTGRIVEDERVFGCVEVGFGKSRFWDASAHTDAVVLRPSIWLDGLLIEREGRYVHPQLAEHCRTMGIPGY
jgi:leucyl aminopeptidase (aminopeptidase T)